MRIVVTGHDGQVARSLLERGPVANVAVVTVGRPQLDLRQPGSIAAAIAEHNPDIVVSAAAYTAVDNAESEPDIADAINNAGAGALSRAAAAMSIPIIHLSTDYVFDGELDRPYREDDPPAPASVYGRTKLAGERAVAAANSNHAILRTAWVYSPFGKNFVRTMLALGSNRDEITVVADQHGAPSSALDLADGIIAVARNLCGHPDRPEFRGIFHMTGRGETTWAGFAEEIFSISASLGGPSARVVPIPTSGYQTPARRPANSRLDTGKLARVHGVRLTEWQRSTAQCVKRLVDQDFGKKDRQ